MDLFPILSQNNRRIEPVVENPMVSFSLLIYAAEYYQLSIATLHSLCHDRGQILLNSL